MEIDLDPETEATVEKRAAKTGFDSPEAYITVLVETAIKELDDTDEDKSELHSRLEDLGYL